MRQGVVLRHPAWTFKKRLDPFFGCWADFLHEEIRSKGKNRQIFKKSRNWFSRLFYIWRLDGALAINFGGVKPHPLGRILRQKPSKMDGFRPRNSKKNIGYFCTPHQEIGRKELATSWALRADILGEWRPAWGHSRPYISPSKVQLVASKKNGKKTQFPIWNWVFMGNLRHTSGWGGGHFEIGLKQGWET